MWIIPFKSIYAQTSLFTETFDEPNGSTSGVSQEGIGWNMNCATTSSFPCQSGSFGVQNNAFEVFNSKGAVRFLTNPISIPQNASSLELFVDFEFSLPWGTTGMDRPDQCGNCAGNPRDPVAGGCRGAIGDPQGCWDFIWVVLRGPQNQELAQHLIGSNSENRRNGVVNLQWCVETHSNVRIEILASTSANNEISWVDQIELTYEIGKPDLVVEPNPACRGGDVFIDDLGDAMSRSWTGPNGFTSIQPFVQLTNVQSADAGTYSMIATDFNGCSNSSSFTLEVIDPAPAQLQAPFGTTICKGASQILRLHVDNVGVMHEYLIQVFSETGELISAASIDGIGSSPNIEFELRSVSGNQNPSYISRVLTIPSDNRTSLRFQIDYVDDLRAFCENPIIGPSPLFQIVEPPTAHPPQPLLQFLSGGMATFNLSERDNEVLGTQNGTVEWYSHQNETTIIPNPESYAITEDTTVFARVTNQGCFSEYVPLLLQITGSQVTVTIEADTLVCAPDSNGAILSFRYVFNNPENDTIEFCLTWIRDGIPLSPPSITITESEQRSISFSNNGEETMDSLILDIRVCDESTLPAGVEVQTPATPLVIYVTTPPPIDNPTFLSDTACLEGEEVVFDLDAITTRILADVEDADLHWYTDPDATIPYQSMTFTRTETDSLYFMLEKEDCDFGPYTFRFVTMIPDTVFVTLDTLTETVLCGFNAEGEEVIVRWQASHNDIDIEVFIRYIIDGIESDTVILLSGGEAIFTVQGVMQSAVFITDSLDISGSECFAPSLSSSNTLSIEVLEVPEINAQDTLSGCGTLTLPAILSLNGTDTLFYTTEPGGMGDTLYDGHVLMFNGNGQNQRTLYIRDISGMCFAEKSIAVTLYNISGLNAELTRENSPAILCDEIIREFKIITSSVPNIFINYSLRIQSGSIDTIVSDTATIDLWKDIWVEYFEGDEYFSFDPQSDTLRIGGNKQPVIITLISIANINGCPITITTNDNRHVVNYLFDIPINPPTPLLTCDNVSGVGNFNLNNKRGEINGNSNRPVAFYRDAAMTNRIQTPASYQSPSANIFARIEIGGCFSEVVPLELQVVESETAHISITHNNPAQLCDFDTIPGETISVTFSTSNQALDYTIYYKTIIDGNTVNREISLTGVVQDATAHLQAIRSYSLQIDSIKADNGTCPINITWDQNPVMVNITRVPQINVPIDLSMCGEFVLPPLMSVPPSAPVTYYSSRGGMGSAMAIGHTVTSTSTIYAYFEEGICTAEDSFFVEILQQTMADIPRDTSDCGSYILPEITGTPDAGFAYFTEPDGMGTMFLPGDTITETTTLFVYDTTGLCPEDQGPFMITIFNSPDISGVGDITFCDSLLLDDLGLDADRVLYVILGDTLSSGDVITTGDTLLVEVIAYTAGCSSSAFPTYIRLQSGHAGSNDPVIFVCEGIPFTPQDFLQGAGPGDFFDDEDRFMSPDTMISLNFGDGIVYKFIAYGDEECSNDTLPFFVFAAFENPSAGEDVDTLFCNGNTVVLRDFLVNASEDGVFIDSDDNPIVDPILTLIAGEPLTVRYVVESEECGSDTAFLVFRLSGFSNITALPTESDLCEGECAEWQLSPISAENLTLHYSLEDGDEITSHSINIPAGMGRTIIFCNTDVGAGNIILLEPDRNYQLSVDSIVSESGCVYTHFTPTFTLQTHAESEESLVGSFCTGDTVRFAGMSFTQSIDTVVFRPGVAPGGCDSTYIIQLIFEDHIEDIILVDLCPGETRIIDGVTLDGSETEVSILIPDASAEGCDTLRTWVVTVLEHREAIIDTIFCDEAEFVIVNGMRYDIDNPTGLERLEGGAANGCDSIITVMLEYRLPVIERIDTTLCDVDDVLIVSGQTFDFNNPFDSVFVGMAANGCDSIIIVNLTYELVEPVDIDISTCDSGFTYVLHGVTFDINNPSAQLIIPGVSPAGCDSIYNVNITFGNEISEVRPLTLCRGETLIFHGFTFDENNLMHTITIPDINAGGCDTVRTYLAEVLEPASELIERVFCDDDEVLMVGNEEFNISNPTGTVTIDGGAANGCDSIVEVRLVYNTTVVENIDSIICDPNFSLVINGQLYDINNPTGVEILEGAATGGCDTIVNISLHFASEIVTPLDINTCDPSFSIEVNGTIYDINQTGGTEVFEGGTIQGCDSIVVVNLQFFNDVEETLEVDLCTGHTIEINGTVYDENLTSGVDTLFGATSFGCDSIVHVNINLLQSPSFALVEQFCDEDDFVLINGVRYDINRRTGVEVLHGAAANGCDSTVFVALVFRPLRQGTFDTIVCDPTYSIVVNGTTYDFENQEGMERFTSNDPSACDSVLHIRLQFDPFPEGVESLEICRGEIVILHGREYSEFVTTGVDTLINAAVNGCDSIVHVTVVINDATEGDLIMEVCDPESFFMVNGVRYDINRTQGVETIDGANQFGCDSTVFIELTYLDNPVSFVDTLLCNLDYFLLVNGVRYDINRPTGTEILMGQAANGCDSTVVIDLFYEADEVEYRIVPSTCRDDSDAVLVIEDITALLPVAYSLDGISGMINQLPMVLAFPSGRSVLFEIETETDCFLREMITAPLPDNIHFDITFQLVGDNMFRLIPSSGVPISAYSWEPNPALSCLNCAEPVATLEVRTTFYLTAVTSGGCILMDSVTLAPFSVPAVVSIPNVFSPNGDGVNDFWYVTTTGTEVIQFTRIHIYDRYGNLLWDNRNPIPNDPSEGWDGTYRNRRLNPGVFVYVIEYLDSRGRNRFITGDITIVDGG